MIQELAIRKEQSIVTEKLESFRQLIFTSPLLKDNALYLCYDLDDLSKKINKIYSDRLDIVNKVGNN